MSQIHRLNWVDWAKTFGIFLVVFGHSFNPSSSEWSWELELLNLIYSFHMPLFFFLSGYLFKVKETNFGVYLWKGVKSLIIPYVFLNAVAMIFWLLVMALQHDFTRVSYYLYHFFIGTGHAPAGPAWFLLSLFFLRAYAYWILKLNKWLQILIVVFAAIMAYVIKIDIWWGADTALMALPFFIAAYYLKQNKGISDCQNIENYSMQLLLLAMCIFITLFLNHIQGRADMHSRLFGNYPLLYYPCAFAGIFMLISFAKLFNKISLKSIQTISSGTIIIMGWHGVVIYYLFVFFEILFPPFNAWNEVLQGLLISILVILLLYYPIILVQKYMPIMVGNRKYRE